MRTWAILLFSLLVTFSHTVFAQTENGGWLSQNAEYAAQSSVETPSHPSTDFQTEANLQIELEKDAADSHTQHIPDGLLTSSRFVSWNQERVFPTPDYELLVQLGGEDLPPSYLYFSPLIPSVLWSEKASGSNPHRISGWKDSNLLYVRLSRDS